ncbi:DnaJ domain-containing protein [Pseudogracilibacillus sp. SO30301A]|uniref:DnaJ domain-containing protein n=1 Tax=Pseudogracilibacillus sp. SO30301A TaxID=3098291 RepID=UPI00300E4F3C
MENYYDIIGISSNASEEEIRAKIKAEMNKWRKRVNAPNAEKRREAEEKQELIQEAEKTLLDPGKRNAYDQELMGQQNTQPNNQHAQPIGAGMVEQNYLDELEGRYEFYLNEDNHYQASLVCQELTKLTPNDAMAWKKLAFSNLMLNNFAEARYEINKAISLKQNEAHFYYTAYLIYKKSTDLYDIDRMKHARAYIDKALSIDPNNTLYNYLSAQLYYEVDDYQQAINILERFKTNDDFENGKDLLALSYVRKVQKEHATRVNYTNGSHQYFFISRELIEQAKEILQYTLSFAKAPNVRDSINEMNRLADEALKFHYNFKFLILLIIGALWFLSALEPFSIIQLAISGTIIYFSWKKFRKPVYVKNQKYINTLNKN